MASKFRESQIENTDQTIPTPDSSVDMSAWDEFNLPEPIIQALRARNFASPTEIQKLALPKAIMEKKDILGAAETGSGKTLAFVVPIINDLLETQTNNQSVDSLWALILTPTRELAIQVKNHVRDLCRFTNIKVQEVVGGLCMEKQNRKLNEKPQIVVGTPGRLWELIRQGNEHLSQITSLKYFVIDEADRMFEEGHFFELDYILERLNSGARPRKRQVFVFSATLTVIHKPPSYVYNKMKGKGRGSLKLSSDQKLSAFVKALDLKIPLSSILPRKMVMADARVLIVVPRLVGV